MLDDYDKVVGYVLVNSFAWIGHYLSDATNSCLINFMVTVFGRIRSLEIIYEKYILKSE